MRRIWILGLLAVLVLGGAAVADEERPREPPGGMPPDMPPDERLDVVLAEWLLRGDDRQAAWAGWIAGERRRHRVVIFLKARLVRVEATRAGYFVAAPILDALIRLEAAAPRHSLARLAGYHTEAVTTLLCRQETYQTAHLEVFRSLTNVTDRVAWAALGNFMVRWRAPAFVAELLDGYEMRRLVRVWDRDPPYPPFRSPGDSVSGSGFFDVPEGYPPIPRYSLSFDETGRAGHELLSHGIRPVYVRRVVDTERRLGFGGTAVSPDPRPTWRHEWLCSFLEGADLPALPPWDVIHVKWTGGRQPWRRQITRAVEEIHARFRRWRDVLFFRGLITPAMWTRLTPTIELDLRDERTIKRRPPPPLPQIDFDPRLPPQPRPRWPLAY